MPNIVALTNGSPHSWIIMNAVSARFGPITVLTERKASRRGLFRQRMKRHGLLWALGQVGFTLLQALIARKSRPRVAQIIREQGLNPVPGPECRILSIDSVNGPECREALGALNPDVVLIFGTRMIRAETLACLPKDCLNLHSGINPKYRGQAGGYWALALGDAANAGVTLHRVDAGVDTGAVVYQAPFQAGTRDNFSTYFYLQAAVLKDLALKAIEDIQAGRLQTFTPDLPSRQHYHPTLWGYMWTGLTRGVW